MTMTRPKVAPEDRQRTQQACNSCKRRKQKCNGLCPCNTCEKRNFECVYDDRPAGSPQGPPPPKRRLVEEDGESYDTASTPRTVTAVARQSQPLQTPASTAASPVASRPVSKAFLQESPVSIAREHNHPSQSGYAYYPNVGSGHPDISVENAARSLQQFSNPTPVDPALSHETGSAPQAPPDEEAVVYSQTRMLQDPTGRLLYVGDSATLSFLQLIRMMIEQVAGPSAFTTDPNRHKILESQFSISSNARTSLLIPHKTTALYLSDAFFTNTHGLIHVFDRKTFYRALDDTYADPLTAETNWLCLLNLVFAIGLTMATPAAGTPEAGAIDKLRLDPVDRAEVFYLNAKSLNDPMVGLEDADFWSVQALILMTIFMLAKSKRNAAFASLGMAIRSAYALGLHREETFIIFNADEQVVRRNVWRTLFVLDRFMSCSLGRPPAIAEKECSANLLNNPPLSANDAGLQNSFLNSHSHAEIGTAGIEAAMRSCSVIGTILKKIYQQRKVTTKLAQEIADVCKDWPKELHAQLHWRQAATATPSQGIAILHVNLFYCHSIVLLTRPFFLFILNDILQQGQTTASNSLRSRRSYARMEKFSEACVIASTHTIVLVYNAYEAKYLPRRNPFVIYFLFAAALILLSNEFAILYANIAGDSCIKNAITIMAYCAETDPQASRLLYILSTFRDVIVQQREQRAREAMSANQLPPFNMKPNINPYGTSIPTAPISTGPMSMGSSLTGAGVKLPSVSNFPSLQSFLNSSSTTATPPPPIMSGSPSPFPPHPSGIHTTRPLEPSLTSPAPPNPLSPHPGQSGAQTPILGLNRELSFSNIFDLSGSLGSLGADGMSVSGGSEGADEGIDFDALWAWGSSGTPVMGGSPKVGGV